MIMMGGRTHIGRIESEYRRIDGQWLRTEYRLMVALAVVALVAETALYIARREMGEISRSEWEYLKSFLLLPAGINGGLCLLGGVMLRWQHLTERQKVWGSPSC